jgi:hypothetical protein
MPHSTLTEGDAALEGIAEKANARPGEDRAFFSPLSEPRGGGGDRFLGKPQPLRPRLSALVFYVAMLSKVSTPHFKNPLTKSRSLEITAKSLARALLLKSYILSHTGAL